MTRSEVIHPGEIYLAALDEAGTILHEGRFALARDQQGRPYPVTATLVGLNPPVIAIGEQGRDTQPFASTATFADCTGGIGVLFHDSARHTNRVWWATADIRYQRQVTLLKLKTDRGTPSDITTETPGRGGVFNDRVWLAWGAKVRQYLEASGWTAGVSSGDRTLTSSTTPTNDPVEYQGGWCWPLGTNGIDVWNGSSWFNVAKSCAGLLVYAGSLWGVSATGVVFSLNISTSAAATKIAAATLAAGDFTDRVTVSDTCSGLVMYPGPDGDVIPVVLGLRTLYGVDATGASPTYVAAPIGPQFTPHRFPIQAAVLGSDNALYISQGHGVVQWLGDVARSVGLDGDDGVPIEYRGGIRQLLNGGESLFALIDATQASGATTLDIYGTGAFEDGVLSSTLGYSWLASREGEGWVVRAISDASAGAATNMFISAAEGTYRIWFSWDGNAYTIDLEQGFYNPLDDPTGTYEAGGDLYYPVLDFGYRENDKIAVLLQIRTALCTSTQTVKPYIQYEQAGTWYPLYNADGTGHGITTNGLHSFLIAANPVPTTTNPLTFTDDPPVGRAHNQSQVWLHLARGDSTTTTPKVVHVTLHAIKSVQPYTQWSPTLDLTQGYDDQTPWQRYNELLHLVQDNASGLLHFAYHPSHDEDDAAGTADVRAVKVTGFASLDAAGVAHEFSGQVRLNLAEVRRVEA